MSTYVKPIIAKDYSLIFEKYREDSALESKLGKLVSLREVDLANIKTQEFREIFDACRIYCREQNFRMGYRLLAFAAFSGINEYADFPGEVGTALLYALHNEKADLALIDELLIATLNERAFTIDHIAGRIEKIRKQNLSSSKPLDFPFSWIFTPITFGCKKASNLFYYLYSAAFPNPHWQPNEPEEDWIKFNHGGGFQSVYHYFILKDWSGYESDSLIDGAWVTPYGTGYESRDFYYACRTPPKHFDVPCILTGEIQRKYLMECPNSYEAKIAPNNVKYMRNLSIQTYPEKISTEYFPILSYVSLQEKVPAKYIEQFYSLFPLQ